MSCVDTLQKFAVHDTLTTCQRTKLNADLYAYCADLKGALPKMAWHLMDGTLTANSHGTTVVESHNAVSYMAASHITDRTAVAQAPSCHSAHCGAALTCCGIWCNATHTHTRAHTRAPTPNPH